MKQTIYEEIQRINLLSKYNSSKTLSEQLLSRPVPNNQGQYSQFNSNNITQTEPKSSPATTTPVNDWGNKYPCVTNNKTSKTGVTTDNMIYYFSNGVYYKSDGTKNIQGTGNSWVKFTCNDPEFKTKTVTNPVAIPPDLKNEEGVKKFQDWLDKNAPNWAKGYTGGIINRGKNGSGYGKFGPRTSAAWKNPTYKDGYLKSLQTPASEKQIAPGPDDDIVNP